MLRTEVKIGATYLHLFEGRIWTIQVNSIDRAGKDFARDEWNGKLVGPQADCQDGDAVWGYVSDLRPMTS